MRLFKEIIKPEHLFDGVSGKLVLVQEVELDNVSELKSANIKSICFFEDPKYSNCLTNLNAGLVIVPDTFDVSLLPNTNLFLARKPYLAFNEIVSRLLKADTPEKTSSVHSTALLYEDTVVEERVVVSEGVVIGKSSSLGSGTYIAPGVIIGSNVQIGKNCKIYSNVSIYPFSVIGNDVIIHSGAVIGSDGFGYIFDGQQQIKINHVGRVVIEDDVEIGANTTIDRATIGETRIGKGTKIDNLVQVGHNCRIGNHSILCSQVGLAGNTEIGNYVYLAGQVGAAGHLKVNDGAMIGAQSGISGDIPAGGKYFGTPAIEAQLQKRMIVAFKRLPEILFWFNRNVKKDK